MHENSHYPIYRVRYNSLRCVSVCSRYYDVSGRDGPWCRLQEVTYRINTLIPDAAMVRQRHRLTAQNVPLIIALYHFVS